MSEEVGQTYEATIDLPIYWISCPHMSILHTYELEWCPVCNDWIDGEIVFEISITRYADGSVDSAIIR